MIAEIAETMRNQRQELSKKKTAKSLIYIKMVPEAGIEPARPFYGKRRILSLSPNV